MKRNPITADSKAREVKKIAKKLYDAGLNVKDLEGDYLRNRVKYLYNIADDDWDAIKECIGWWFLDLEKGGIV